MKKFKLILHFNNEELTDDQYMEEIKNSLLMLSKFLNTKTAQDLQKYQNIFDINENLIGQYALKDVDLF